MAVYGAGGGIVCAASRPLGSLGRAKLVIDQALYWLIVDTENEARHLTGLFNSPAIDPPIAAFQPQGQQKERHIHRLPKLVTPRFDPSDPLHQEVVDQASTLLDEWQSEVGTDAIKERLDRNRALAWRRSFLRRLIADLPAFGDYAKVCWALYNSTVD